MSFARLMRKAWHENHLFSALIELTYACNLDCAFCFNDLGLRGTRMTLADYVRFFDDLAAMNVLQLTLSGGEPLAHPDFMAIGAHARASGFVVRIKSNGHALRGDIALRIRDEIDPFLIETSVHGATAETHDKQTRVPGSFMRLMRNLEEARELGLRIKLNSTLTAWNEHETEALMDLAESLQMPLQIDPEVTRRDDGDSAPLRLTASREGLARFFRLSADRAKRAREAQEAIAEQTEETGHSASPHNEIASNIEIASKSENGPMPQKHCGAGSSGIAVDPFGNVYPCVQWRRAVGNLHERSIREIWSDSKALNDVRAITQKVARVIADYGPTGAMLNFCPGAAEANTGNPTRVYASAERQRDVAMEMERGGRRVRLPVVA